ncbi:MAG: NifU family protein [Pseudonocardiaceae bacterium]
MPGTNTPDVQAVGSQVEELLSQLSVASDPATARRAEELVALLVDFYGAGLARIVELLGEQALRSLLDDKLVAGLLVLHDLHPQSTEERVLAALEQVRPYLGSHAGDVEYLGLDEDGTVRLRLAGSCDGCPSSSVTVTLAIEKAIDDLAPEVTKVDVANMAPDPMAPSGRQLLPLAPVDSKPATPAAAWVEVEGVDTLPQGRLTATRAGSTDAVVCNVAGSLYAYADRCAGCGGGLADGALEGALLVCASCGQQYDAVRAGRGVGRTDLHLDPLPLLTEGGSVRIAAPAGAGS